MNGGVYIDVDITNDDPDLLRLVIATLPYMDGWTYDNSVSHGLNQLIHSFDQVTYYLHFDLVLKIVSWRGEIPPSDATRIRNAAELSASLEFINNLSGSVQNIHLPQLDWLSIANKTISIKNNDYIKSIYKYYQTNKKPGDELPFSPSEDYKTSSYLDKKFGNKIDNYVNELYNYYCKYKDI